MNERNINLFDYLAILRRRMMWFIGGFLLCVIVGGATALLLPATYQTSTTIAVQAPAVSLNLVPGRAELNRDERLLAISQQLKSQTVLARVAREEQLIGDRSIEQVTSEILGHMNVQPTKPIAQDGERQVLSAFDIFYTDGNPDRARRIADRIANVFVDEHSKSRELQAEETSEFLSQQLQQSQQRISSLEGRLRTAKERFQGKLPEQTSANLQTVAGMRQQLENTSNNLRSEQDRLSLIERQLQAMKQGSAAVGVGAGSGAAGAAAAASPQQRVTALQRQLAAARTQYKDTHPEVQELERELQMARQEAAALSQQPESTRQELLAGDPMYQQAMEDRNLTQLRIRSLQRTESQLQRDIVRYQAQIEASPMVEQELSSLQREYDMERENNKNLSQRYSAALEQEQIARNRGGERFSVLYPAALPGAPISPNRLRIFLLSIGAGFGLGLALVIGRDYADQSIRDARAVQDEFDVPVLAEIPRIHA
jgi:succinoglycan biosynthesis transport protein ExoP